MPHKLNKVYTIINQFLLFLLFIAAVFNSLRIQVHMDVVFNYTATGTGFTLVVDFSDNGLFNSSVSVRMAQGNTPAKAGQPQHDETHPGNIWDHGTESTNGVQQYLYGLHWIKDTESTENDLAKALAINDIQFSTRFPQGVIEPVPHFEAWVIEEASNWFANPPNVYEGVFRETCPIAKNALCRINDEEHEALKEAVTQRGGQPMEIALSILIEPAYAGSSTRAPSSWFLDVTNRFWTMCKTLCKASKTYIPRDVFIRSFNSLSALDSEVMTVLYKDNSQWIYQRVHLLTTQISLQGRPSAPMDEQMDLPTTTSFATNSPDNNITPTTASSSLFNTTFSGSPTTDTSVPALIHALIDMAHSVDLVDWTELEATQHSNRHSPRLLLGYWTFIGLSIYVFLTALSSYLSLPPQQWVEFAFSQSPLTIRHGGWVYPDSLFAVDTSIPKTCEFSVGSDKYFVGLLFGAFWRAYTSFYHLVDAVLVFYGVFPGPVEDHRLDYLFEEIVSGKIIGSHQEGVLLERFVSHPVVLRSFSVNMDPTSAKQFFVFERRQLPLAIEDSIMKRYPNMSIDYESALIAEIEESWISNLPYDSSQEWFNPAPEPSVQSDEGAREILEPCTILYRPYLHRNTNTFRLMAIVINDFPLDDPDYAMCDWYDPDFSKRQHKTQIPGTTIEFTSHCIKAADGAFSGGLGVASHLFQTVANSKEQHFRNIWVDRPAHGLADLTDPLCQGFRFDEHQWPHGNAEGPNYLFRPAEYEGWIMSQAVKEYRGTPPEGMELILVEDEDILLLCDQFKALRLSCPSSTS